MKFYHFKCLHIWSGFFRHIMLNINNRKAALIVSEILLNLKSLSKPGTSLDFLEEEVITMIKDAKATSVNKGYKMSPMSTPYPATMCACINDEVIHCPPAGKVLKEGDIVTYDIGIRYKDKCGDAAITVPVGEISNRKQRLLRYSKNATYEGVKQVRAGVRISEIGKAIQRYTEINGYNVFKEFCGHHINIEMHEKPLVPNFEDINNNERLIEGSIICIEPTLTPGRATSTITNDNWTMLSNDGQPTSMFEVMVLVKENGYEVLTNHC